MENTEWIRGLLRILNEHKNTYLFYETDQSLLHDYKLLFSINYRVDKSTSHKL